VAEKRIPTAVYCRASTQEEIEFQVGLAFSYIKHFDLELCGLYLDLDSHAEWEKLKQDAGTAQIILLNSTDSVEENASKLDSIAKSLDIVIETVDGSYTSDPAEIGIQLTDWDEYEARQLAAQFRRRDYGKLISTGMRNSAGETGHHSIAPYGYQKAGFGYVIDETTAPYVRKMFEMAAQGATNAEIAKSLDTLGAGTPSGTPSWRDDTVRRILSNRVYLGKLEVGKNERGADRIVRKPKIRADEYDANHPAIIDDEVFEKVQQILRERSRKRTESIQATKGNEERDRNEYGNLARCKLCDTKLVFVPKTEANRRKVSIFRCVNHTGAKPKGEPLPKQPVINLDEMNQQVMDICNDYIVQVAAIVKGRDLIQELLLWERENAYAYSIKIGREFLELYEQYCKKGSTAEFLDKSDEMSRAYPDLISILNGIEDEQLAAEQIPTELTAYFGEEPLDLYQDEFDIEKVKTILTKVLLKPDGTLEAEYKVDIRPWQEKFLGKDATP